MMVAFSARSSGISSPAGILFILLPGQFLATGALLRHLSLIEI